jgi:hypothetical protein
MDRRHEVIHFRGRRRVILKGSKAVFVFELAVRTKRDERTLMVVSMAKHEHTENAV